MIVTRREWLIAVSIALVVTLVMQIPYALGYLLAPPDVEYTGLLINVEDGSYFSAIQQGIDGAWLYHLPFTTEEHSPAFIEVFYLALGHLARVMNLSAVMMWHLARTIAGLILFIVVYGFIAIFLDEPFQRRVAFFLVLLGSGYAYLGHLSIDSPKAWDAVPVEWRIPEAHVFYSALTYPHFSLSVTLLMITLGSMLFIFSPRAPNHRLTLLMIGAGISNILLGIVYPFLIYLIVGVSIAYILFLILRTRKIPWRAGMVGLVVLLMPAPLFLYYLYALMTNPILQQWSAQAATISPSPVHFLLTYVTLLPFAFSTLRIMRRFDEMRQRDLSLLWIWIGVVAVLLYTPISQQRRFVEGVQIPLAILATVGWFQVFLPWLSRTRGFVVLSQRPGYSVAGLQRLVVGFMILLSSVSSGYIWLSSVALLGWIQPYPLFRPFAELRAMDWLRVNTISSEVVFSAYWTGSLLPARAGNTVFIGQRYETIRFEEKQRASEKFFDQVTNDAWRLALLRDQRIAYVFWGRGERDLGSFDPNRADYLQRVFYNDVASIFRVRLP